VLGINISVFVIATIIGCFFINTSVYGEDYFPECQKLYSFVDLTGNWTALFAFCIITIAILGGLINRKTKKIKTEQSKSFVPAAIVTISIFSISILMEVIKAIGNLYLSVD
jgi:hypothetical protein